MTHTLFDEKLQLLSIFHHRPGICIYCLTVLVVK